MSDVYDELRAATEFWKEEMKECFAEYDSESEKCENCDYREICGRQVYVEGMFKEDTE